MQIAAVPEDLLSHRLASSHRTGTFAIGAHQMRNIRKSLTEK